jgi:addiction module RelB/DinJ family antitoxin
MMDSVTIRVDDDVKGQVVGILGGLGLDISSATRAFYYQIILHNGLPFKVEYPAERLAPEAETRFLEAEEHLRDGTAGHPLPDALFDALGI